MKNKYAEELRKEKEMLRNANPFSVNKSINKRSVIEDNFLKNDIQTNVNRKVKNENSFFYPEKVESGNYFHLILSSDYQDLELDIRGLHYINEFNETTGKKEVVLVKRPDHYLSDQGAQDLLFELKGHLSSDIKLGFLTTEEFLKTQEIIRKNMLRYIRNNLYSLGMDTEAKQRKATTLSVIILNRIRAVYSRSIKGLENQRSHGDITLSGGLDVDKENKFNMEDMKN